MEEENTSMGSSQEGSNKSLKETFKSGSPDEVRDRVRDVVEKGVAAVAGALRGFNEETQRSDVAGQTKGAIHQAAETAKSTVSSVTEEAKSLKEPLREAGQKLGETARDLRGAVREEVDSTKGALQGARSSGGGSSYEREMGESELERSSAGMRESELERSSSGMGGSELDRSSTGQGSEMPDISRTPLAEPDRKLQGRELSSQHEEE